MSVTTFSVIVWIVWLILAITPLVVLLVQWVMHRAGKSAQTSAELVVISAFASLIVLGAIYASFTTTANWVECGDSVTQAMFGVLGPDFVYWDDIAGQNECTRVARQNLAIAVVISAVVLATWFAMFRRNQKRSSALLVI